MAKAEPIPKDHVDQFCQPGKGEVTCAYLTMKGGGWRCGKDKSLGVRGTITYRLEAGTMTSKGDNCAGWPTPDPCDGIEPGDPRYDGFRITELWIVTMVDPADNQEGIMYEPSGSLMASDERRAKHLAQLVEAHNARGGPALQIKHFILTD